MSFQRTLRLAAYLRRHLNTASTPAATSRSTTATTGATTVRPVSLNGAARLAGFHTGLMTKSLVILSVSGLNLVPSAFTQPSST